MIDENRDQANFVDRSRREDAMPESDQIVPRPRYTDRIAPYADTPVIKVLTGVRRSGKSTILDLIAQKICQDHPRAQTVRLNLESAVGLAIRTPEQLLDHLTAQAPDRAARAYFFLDEVQQVPGWERVVNTLRVDWDCDIYLTGSNSRMLSGDLATHLAGRYVEIHVQPLAFAEYRALRRLDLTASERASASDQEFFQDYLALGGFPGLRYFRGGREASMTYLRSVYDSALVRDVIQYHQIRDVDLFHRVVTYCLANIGRTFSANSLSRFLRSERRTVSVDTVLNYLTYCTEAFLLSRVPRHDLTSKRILAVEEKYYVVDHGLREAMGLSNSTAIELVLENIVYNELTSRGWTVSVGRAGAQEVDFVARRDTKMLYVQVSYLLASEETRRREFGALLAISDNHPKLVLSLDPLSFGHDGVEHRNLVEWLLAVEQ